MKVLFKNADREKTSLALLASDLGITLVEENADLTVEVEKCEADTLSVALDGKIAKITYGGSLSRFHRALGLLFASLQ